MLIIVSTCVIMLLGAFTAHVGLATTFHLLTQVLVKVSFLCHFIHVHHHYYTDINECSEGSSGCDQICRNEIGGYNCSCHIGYTLLANNQSCQG